MKMPLDDDSIFQFRRILKLLTEAEIRFVLIGGVAMALHGADLVTRDLDITFAIDSDNLEKLSAWINQFHPRPFGFTAADRFEVTSGLIERAKFLILKTDLGPIDLLKSPSGIDSFEGVISRAASMSIDGFIVLVASIDDLIAMKKAANRPKDQLHLMELYALKKLIAEGAEERAAQGRAGGEDDPEQAAEKDAEQG
jgi:predicted nucleotidyltransferase